MAMNLYNLICTLSHNLRTTFMYVFSKNFTFPYKSHRWNSCKMHEIVRFSHAIGLDLSLFTNVESSSSSVHAVSILYASVNTNASLHFVMCHKAVHAFSA